jgi:hypothetical protein
VRTYLTPSVKKGWAAGAAGAAVPPSTTDAAL